MANLQQMPVTRESPALGRPSTIRGGCEVHITARVNLYCGVAIPNQSKVCLAARAFHAAYPHSSTLSRFRDHQA